MGRSSPTPNDAKPIWNNGSTCSSCVHITHWCLSPLSQEILVLPTYSDHICQTSCKSPLTKHLNSPLFQATCHEFHLCAHPVLLIAGHIKALGLLHARRGEKQGSNYNGMGGRGIVRGRTDAERQEKTISLIQLINIINVIIFLLWFKHSIQKSCLLVRVSDKSLQIQRARCCTVVTVFP